MVVMLFGLGGALLAGYAMTDGRRRASHRRSHDAMTSHVLGWVVVLILCCLGVSMPAQAQDSEAGGATTPTFGGDLWHRSKLIPDWGGFRSRLAEKGVTLDADVTQFYQGVTSDGEHRGFEYGGHGDYVLHVDAGKLVSLRGLVLTVRAEHWFGQNVNEETGAFLPAAIAADLPAKDSRNVYLTDVLLTQYLSDSFAVFVGKMQTLDGDKNAFAHGRGKDQFLNFSLVGNPAFYLTLPYSTLGAGFMLLGEDHEPWLSVEVLNSTDTTTTAGFDELFREGVVVNPEIRLPTRLFGQPGHHLLGGTWNSREFLNLAQDPRIILPAVPAERAGSSWSVYWNFDQYLFTDSRDPSRGWGLFGRAGLADKHTNPLHWVVSAGLGGNSPIPGREADTFGIGWYYGKTSSEIDQIAQSALGPIGNGQGGEIFYNIAATPWLHLTPDFQIIRQAQKDVDTAVVIGLRAKVDF
jgi:porin